MRRSRPTSIRWARHRRCYPTKAEEGHFASHVLGRKVPWNREVLQGRRWRHHPPRGQGPTPRGVDESRRTVAWQANAPPLAQASACAFRIVDSLPCLRERALNQAFLNNLSPQRLGETGGTDGLFSWMRLLAAVTVRPLGRHLPRPGRRSR